MSANVALTTSELVKVKSELLGELDVAIDQMIVFQEGIPGFPEARSWALLPTGREGAFWLQSADFTALSFLLVDPFHCFPGYYHIDLSDEDIARLGTRESSQILVLAIVTLGSKAEENATANLRAPLLFNLATRAAHQSIRPDEGFGVREVIDPGVFPGVERQEVRPTGR